MTMEAVLESVLTVADRYGEEVLARLLELAPLVAGSGNAWRFAVEAMEQGDDGMLVIKVPGLPGAPPAVTWMGAGWRVVVEPEVERGGTDRRHIV